MVLYMVFRHCVLLSHLTETWWGGVLTYYPLLFFMAWFFFKGGMFFQTEPLQHTIRKSVDRLLIPYIVFSLLAIIIGVILYGSVLGKEGIHRFVADLPIHLKREGAVEFNAPLWFLPSLFFVRVFFSFSQALHLPAWIVTVSALVSAWGIQIAGLPIGLYFGNIALGLFFFCAGYLLKECQFKKMSLVLSSFYYVFFLVYCFITQAVAGDFITNRHIPFLPTIVFFISGCVLINNLFKRAHASQFEFLARAGEQSMAVYITHFIVLSTITLLNDNTLKLSPYPLFLLLVLSQLIVLPCLTRLLSRPGLLWMTGGKSTSKLCLDRRLAMVGTTLTAFVMSTYVIYHLVLSFIR